MLFFDARVSRKGHRLQLSPWLIPSASLPSRSKPLGLGGIKRALPAQEVSMESSVAHLNADRDPTYKIIDLSPTAKELSPDATEIVAFLQAQGSDPASAQSSPPRNSLPVAARPSRSAQNQRISSTTVTPADGRRPLADEPRWQKQPSRGRQLSPGGRETTGLSQARDVASRARSKRGLMGAVAVGWIVLAPHEMRICARRARKSDSPLGGKDHPGIQALPPSQAAPMAGERSITISRLRDEGSCRASVGSKNAQAHL